MSFRLYCEGMEERANPSGPGVLDPTDPLIPTQSGPPGDNPPTNPNDPPSDPGAWDPVIVVDPTDGGF